MMKPSKVLNKAADILDKKGWTQGAMARTNPSDPESRIHELSWKAKCFCSMGAISRATHDLYPNYFLSEKHSDKLDKVIFKSARYLESIINKEETSSITGKIGAVYWNDDPKQNKENVIATFRKAAKLAEEEGN